MARHDLRCGDCGYRMNDVNIPVSQGARAWADVHPCPECGAGYLHAIPAIRLSLFSDGASLGGAHDFAKVTLPVEDPGAPGGFRQETVASLHDIRRLERESEIREANGEGRRMVWRDYSQDGSNRDRHTLGPDPTQTPNKTFLNGQPVLVRRGDPVVEAHGVPDEFKESA